ncbi:hypothetical protein EHQ43_06075 [Leptospira bouyouniensis]|uniref:Uncharacterized protein n=1 Tax=Leptospira bouyouniensis TaxID=2484911 RepID=A0A7I0HUM2_9LEPT|nr:hypothetical protein EHQ43_06075 [Leptospira bouyouniensis]
MKMILKDLKNEDIVNLYSEIIKELKNRKIIRTKNILGDLAEFISIETYNKTPGLPNLQAAPPGTQNIDAISKKGERYSIKATSGNLTGVFYGLNDPDSNNPELQKFEFVLIVIFNNEFELQRILEINWNQFLKFKRWHKTMRAWNLSITKELITSAKTIYSKVDIT